MTSAAQAIAINISKEFAQAPGARNVDEGLFSGEDFLKRALLPRFKQALASGDTLFVDLDGTEGYATSFLEEAFGGLARIYPPTQVLETIDFKSLDEPLLVDEIRSYILEARHTGRR